MAIIAAMKRSSSAFDSDSVGSTMIVPATGKLTCRCVEAVVHQALGDVDLGDAGGRLDRADVEDALVRDAAVLAGVEHRVVRLRRRAT
jgi:hypothetical protein